jgi:hypothetical protein
MDGQTNMAKAIAAVVTAFGLGKLIAIYLMNKCIIYDGKREFVRC